MLHYGLILALICAVASGLLAGVNLLTRARILAQAQAEEQAGLKEVLPEGVRFEPVKSGEALLYYRAYDDADRLVGVAFKAAAKGYSSAIQTLAGMTQEGAITRIKILEQSETPGLGMRITEPEFTRQFNNKNNLDEIQAITGATISSGAVIEAVKRQAEEIKEWLKDGK